ncbi:acetyl-CoA C-acetyltransferase [Paraburkholderia pallida]|uniref:Acetyl-CoA C-acetyltransferase n=1 Tax=Paraburkholderia pallida TaxID=2547399 RepID=A0A4P7DA32_9BURK|nr:acetyl-CoA C-acetyltransferase [Paraburkholderia pallida]QBR04110.1 acetyl-CoA C-acetyltransferase [Paraburkholderia pallida]
MTHDAYILDAVRSPRGRGKKDGGLHTLSPVELASELLKAIPARNPGFDSKKVEDVIFGCAEAVNDQGANLARSAALYAGYDDSVAGSTVARFCGSGLEALNIAATKVMAGQGDLFVAGGIEMMSLVPMLSTGGPTVSDTFFNDKSWATPQGVSADLIATIEGFSREDVDAWAAQSHQRAARAVAHGAFNRSIVPIRDSNGTLMLDHDELVRPETSVESLAKLKPSFERAADAGYDITVRRRYPQLDRLLHVHHAGNSSGIADGASAVVIGNLATAASLGIKPRARIRAIAQVGIEPCIMLTGPVESSRRALARCGLSFKDVDLFEVNEAFASVVLYFNKHAGVDPEKVNVNGGAIALGHPIGATGGMLVGTLLDELERRDARIGVATMCTGLGMAVSTVIERI